jgi:hypothetical protein
MNATGLEGRKIVKVRKLTAAEKKRESWYGDGVAIDLDDGTVIYPSSDEEGNGPGALFSFKEGKTYRIFPAK